MDSIVKFLIKMQADSGNVLSVAKRTTEQLEHVNQRATAAGQSIRKAFSLSNFKSSLSSIPGMDFLMNPYTMVAAGVGAIAKIGSQAEKTSVAFKVLVGDENKAAKVLGDINNFANDTPFSNLNLENAAQTMLNFGVSSDSVMGKLKMLGDISMGDAQKLESLSLVYGQVNAAQKLQGQDLLQFINAGWNPLKELQSMTGKSYKELQEAMSKGQITADMVSKAMEHATAAGGQFHGMMEETSQTAAGKMSTALGQLQQRIKGIFDKLKSTFVTAISVFQTIGTAVMDIVESIATWIAESDTLKNVFAFLTKLTVGFFTWLGGAVKAVIKFFNTWGTEIGFVASMVGGAIAVFYAYQGLLWGIVLVTKAWAAIQAIINILLNANPIGIVAMAIGAMAAAVVYCWNKFAGFRAFILTMWDTMKGFGNIIKQFVIDRFVGLLEGIKGVGSALAKLFKGDFKGAWDTAKGAASNLLGVNAGKNAISATQSLVRGVSSNYNTHLTQEQRKEGRKSSTKQAKHQIATPGLKGSNTEKISFGAGDGGKKKHGRKGASKTAEALATGGSRSTSIQVHIGKFFDNINVTMSDKTDTAELQRIVVECMNRALAIATSTDR